MSCGLHLQGGARSYWCDFRLDLENTGGHRNEDVEKIST
jgi:hypothetical protein